MSTPDYRFLFQESFAPDTAVTRPHVTLTYAQSLDGKIAGNHGQQLILSGPDSMKATHMYEIIPVIQRLDARTSQGYLRPTDPFMYC